MKKVILSFGVLSVLFSCTAVDLDGNTVSLFYSEYSHNPPAGEAFEAPGKMVSSYDQLSTAFRAEAMNITTGFKYHRGDAADNAFESYRTDTVAIRYCKKLSRGQCVLSRYNDEVYYKDLNDYKIKMGLKRKKTDEAEINRIVSNRVESTKKELEESNRIEREKLQIERQKLEELKRLEAERIEIERERLALERSKIENSSEPSEDLQNARELEILIVKNTQSLLSSLGYSPETDGTYGVKTITAIKAFQRDNEIDPIDGEITEDLLLNLQTALKNAKEDFDIGKYIPFGSGSGFLANKDGFIVTNAHVIDECELVTVDNDVKAQVVKVDRVNDIAILKGEGLKKEPLALSQNDPELGDRVFPSGFPINSLLENLNFTSGNVSSEAGLFQNTNQFQFTAPIQPGNSGGPIFNEYGGVIGITVASASIEELEQELDTLLQNINFGIRKSSVQRLLDQVDADYDEGNPFWFANEKRVAEVAKKGSVLIKCWKSP